MYVKLHVFMKTARE